MVPVVVADATFGLEFELTITCNPLLGVAVIWSYWLMLSESEVLLRYSVLALAVPAIASELTARATVKNAAVKRANPKVLIGFYLIAFVSKYARHGDSGSR